MQANFRFIIPVRTTALVAFTAAAILAAPLGTSCLAAEKNAASEAAASGVQVTVVKATNACFSDMVRVTGFIVPRKEALVSVDREGSKVTDILVREGDLVTENQELIRLTPPPSPQGGKSSLRAPVAGLVTKIMTIVGAPASPMGGPMVRIAVDNDIELDAEVPGIHALKLNPGATARISRDDGPDLAGRVRLIAPAIERTTQLGHVRVSVTRTPALKVGMFARATIDARRSCGVAIPRSAIDHLTVQVVRGNTVETRRVRVGLVSDSSIEILEGVKEGELVVADAGTSLHDGDLIKTMFADETDRSRVR
ncbi:MAG: efflux RND transporter periplasmic adaptor subunit [Rhodopseudomonas sp.]|uniref:efflux RND transporter periplasmic adaptor subunit n=1 Tax=Rhodopseudomonas sp. TaxID=1078 RepID=UPI00184152DB|nr:efflux RND transporter periplasmic adaptor subunit [Rhodopseudomonas sp.]NVN88324.1 efflux RND transporter periplasmic adaptor subunit [Rhodopseudomonas sp.]